MGCASSFWFPLVCVVVTAAGLSPQQPAAGEVPADRQRFVVREADTGIALPGVTFHLGQREREESHLVDGWLRRFGRRPASNRVVRSDPDGRFVLAGADRRLPMAIGPGHEIVQKLEEAGTQVLLVRRCESRAVHVVDAAGKAVAGFGVFRKGTGEVAVTDASGEARFAPQGAFVLGLAPMPNADDEVFLPAQWIGSTEVRARVAASGRENLWCMQLPPCVTLRLRFLRKGVPAAVPVSAAWLDAPVDHALLWARPETQRPFVKTMPEDPVTCCGIEVGPIEWAGEVRGEVLLGRLRLPFAVAALPAKGIVLELDLETDPPRPWLCGVVRRADRAAPNRVRIGALTDAGTFEDEVAVGADGRLRAGFDANRLRGTRLHRVWIDALDAGSGASLLHERDEPLRNDDLDLGELQLVAHPPVVRGRVVDSRGAPLPNAAVVARGPTTAGGAADVPLTVDGAGRFTLVGPVFRDANGGVAKVAVDATVPHVHPGQIAPQPPPFRSATGEPSSAGSEIALVIPDAPTGAFVLEVRGAPPTWRQQLQVCVFDGDNTILLHDDRLRGPGTADAWCRGSIEMPTGRRRVQLRVSNGLLHQFELDVTPSRPGEPDAVQIQSLDWEGLVRQRSVRAVDASGQPIAAARVHTRAAGHKSGVMPDGSGALVWLEPCRLPHTSFLVAPGKQVVVLDATAVGDVTMVEAVPVGLRLALANGERLDGAWTVMLDPADENGLAGFGTLAADGAASFPGPASGRYHVAVFARFDQFARRVRVGTVDLALGKAAPESLAIDATALAALRALQSEPQPKK